MSQIQPTPSFPRRRGLLVGATCLGLALGLARPCLAQLDPGVFGLDIPPGPVVHEDQLCVQTHDEDGNSVVARVHVRVGDHRIVLLPDGSLVSRPLAAANATQRPFTAATKDELAATLTAELPAFKTKQTRRYLYLYNTSESFAEATSRILETMFPGVVLYAQAQKIEVHSPEVPLVVIMFRTEDEFQRFRRMPAGVIAYYNTLSNRVVMYEESRLRKLKPDLAVRQAIATIAHEGAHQILHNIGVQQRLSMWPMWLSEGFAEFFAPTSTSSRLKWKGAGQVNDMRMFELEQYWKGSSLDQPAGEMVEQTVVAARLTSTGYAAAWSLTHYLAKNCRSQFHDYVREVSRLRPLEGGGQVVLPGVVPENLVLFQKHFGSDLVEIEKRLVLHLKKLPYNDPFAQWPHYVAMVAFPAGKRVRREVNLFHTSDMAEHWRRERIDKLPAADRSLARSFVRQFPNRLLAERFARQMSGGR